jgi:hypothetical protein
MFWKDNLLDPSEAMSIYGLGSILMFAMSFFSFLFFFIMVFDASIGVTEVLLIIIGFLFLTASILILRLREKSLRMRFEMYRYEEFLEKRSEESPNDSKPERLSFEPEQKNDSSVIFLTKTILIAITILNVVLFVGGSIWSGITLDSIRDQYTSAQKEIGDVQGEYQSAKTELDKSKRALKETVKDMQIETDKMDKKISKYFTSHIDNVKAEAKKAKEDIQTAKGGALTDLEKAKGGALFVIGKIIFDKNEREKFRKDLLTQIRAELIENFKAKYKSKDLGSDEQFRSDITDGVVDELIDELDKKKLKEEISKELVKKYQESKLVEQVSTQSVTENKKKTGTTKGKAKRQ